MQLAQTNVAHRADLNASRNYVQHQQARTQNVKGMGMEETVRAAVRSGQWPTKSEAMAASFLPGGWEEYQRAGRPNNTLNASLRTLSSGAAGHPASRGGGMGSAGLGDGLAERYGLLPQSRDGGGRPAPVNTHHAEELSSRPSSCASSSMSPLMRRADCPLTAATLPRTGSAPDFGVNVYATRNDMAFSQKMMRQGGLQGIIASGRAAGSRDFIGVAGHGRSGRHLGF